MRALCPLDCQVEMSRVGLRHCGVERDFYSQRMATMGLIRDACNAGSSEAQLAIPSRTAAEARKTQGSCGDISYRKLVSTRDARMAATNPATHPTTAMRTFSLKTNATTCTRCAPRAMRMPISLVRRAVAYASVP